MVGESIGQPRWWWCPIWRYPVAWARKIGKSKGSLLFFIIGHAVFFFLLMGMIALLTFVPHTKGGIIAAKKAKWFWAGAVPYAFIFVVFFPGLYLYAIYRLIGVIDGRQKSDSAQPSDGSAAATPSEGDAGETECGGTEETGMARTTSLALLEHAKDFIEAADVLDVPGYQHLRPTYYLYGHGIELALKAFLRGAGMSISDMKKIGHDLERAVEEANKLSLRDHCVLESNDLDAINLLNVYYRAKEFEYTVAGSKTVPQTSQLGRIARQLLDTLRPFCYAQRERHKTNL
jgi:hypothetical protein